MVGFCGVFGNLEHSIDEMSKKLFYHGDEKSSEYSDHSVDIEIVLFSNSVKDQPVISREGNILVWIWGNIYGYENNGDYISKKSYITESEYLVDLYKEYGFEFLRNLNGKFAAVLYEPKKERLYLITDKFSTHPIFYTKDENGNLVFSTHLQSLPSYPSVNTSFQKKYLYQFLIFERVFGVNTPLRGIKEVHPGSILSFDLDSKEIANEIYWLPKYKPEKRSYSKIKEEFSKLFREVMSERIDKDLCYGLYLSGGSDSRLILATIRDLYPDLDILCYHMNERMNREAKIAEKVAGECDCEFKFLKRKEDYLERILDKYSSICMYNGWFHQAHGLGFVEKIREEVDVIFNGLFAGVILQRNHFPRKSIKIPFIKENFYLPILPDTKDKKNFIRNFIIGNGATSSNEDIPVYLKDIQKKEILQDLLDGFKTSDSSISFQGINYPSYQDFINTFILYPLTNDQGFVAYNSEIQSMQTKFPFIDIRILEFSLSLPQNVLLKKNLVNSTVKNINYDLSEIEHSNIGLPLKYPWVFHYCAKQYNTAKRKLFPSLRWEGPWGDISEIIRDRDFVKKKIFENKQLINNSDFFDWDDIIQCYNEHKKGKNKTYDLLALLTFLENPFTKNNLKS